MPIDVSKLRGVKTIVAHRNPNGPCPDGVASALILRDVLPDAEVRFVTYGEELEELEATEGMLFCDIAPTAGRASDFVRAGAIVLDHHATHRDAVEQFGELGVLASEPGVSGAVLAFREVWLPLAYQGGQRPPNHATEGRSRGHIEHFATLAGIRDTWQRKHPQWDEACRVAAALAFWRWQDWPKQPFDSYGYTREFMPMIAIGDVLVEKNREGTERTLSKGYRLTTKKGTRVLVIPTLQTSDAAEANGDRDEVVMGFGYGLNEAGGIKVIFSLRSQTGYDVGAFAKSFPGGGGHKTAAGFSCTLDWNDPQPFELALYLLEKWERGSAL